MSAPRVSDSSRKALAECIGSASLAATVVGSGIAAETLSPDDVGLQLLENALITGGVLVAQILALSDAFARIAPSSAPLFVLMQLPGGPLGLAAAVVLHPGSRRLAEQLTSAGDRERTADLDATDFDPVETRS